MKIAISNIAWDFPEEEIVIQRMKAHQITGVEIAPTKIWPKLTEVTCGELYKYRQFWENNKIEIVALQALLFGKPNLGLFNGHEIREDTISYLTSLIEIASGLGAKVLVFGSPKNRQKGGMDQVKAMDIAVSFFSRLADIAATNHTTVCIEPNPSQYECDFIMNADEGIELVKLVNKPGFKLHLDSGVLFLNRENSEEVIEKSMGYLAHFHISEPNLGLIGSDNVDHPRIAKILRSAGYHEWASIEMRNGLKTPNIKSIEIALEFVTNTYR